jgi:outer membrane receptor protein involved in Fe transport
MIGMSKKILWTLLLTAWALYDAQATNKTTLTGNLSINDTVRTYLLNEVIVTPSRKETNPLKKLPGSVSVLSSGQIEGMKIEALPDISTLVPNFFVPDYGSKLTSPIYIRGVGNRITSQASGVYIDNVPIQNKAGYDFEFMDIHCIELLRGPQGALFGRNSMGGLLHVLTPSPLDYQRTKISISGGNYGLFQAKISKHTILNDRLGLSVAGYYNRHDGYFTNEYSGKKADPLETAGGRLRLDYRLSDAWKASLITHYNFSDQGAFPYKQYDRTTGIVSSVNYNDEGAYLRRMGLTALNLEYQNDKLLLMSTTSHQYLHDNMKMDQDYTPEAIYSIRQQQKQQAFTEELTLKSNTKTNYQWLFGLFGSYDKFNTDITENWTPNGIQTFLDAMLTPIKDKGARMPDITVIDEGDIPNPTDSRMTTFGGAVFHQSTYNNFFLEGLSLTAGLRLDYGKVCLDYNSAMNMGLKIDLAPIISAGRPVPPPSFLHGDTTLQGSMSLNYLQALPKIALKYEWNSRNYAYASATKGFNPGGYNIQLFAEKIMQILANKMAPYSAAEAIDWNQEASFAPEYSWTYELGYKGEWIKNRLSAEIALFYIDINDMQLETVSFGRKLTNVGKAVNKGIDLQLHAQLFPVLSAGINYGYIHATFKEYEYNRDKEINFKGNYLPFVPRQTFSVYAAYTKNFSRSFIEQFNIQAQYNGTDKIYWTPRNDAAQNFYGLLNLKAGLTKGAVSLNVWAKNLLNVHYNTFYFVDALGKSFLQQGKPALYGVDVAVSF